jgi:hypothetical protein
MSGEENLARMLAILLDSIQVAYAGFAKDLEQRFLREGIFDRESCEAEILAQKLKVMSDLANNLCEMPWRKPCPPKS